MKKEITFILSLSLAIAALSKASGQETISWSEALKQEPGWYGSPEATRIADNVRLYQHASGGWPKNIDMAEVLSEEKKKRLREEKAEGKSIFRYATIDNRATYTQMRYLARVYAVTDEERFKDAFLRGLDYLLAAQYDNGGWPQYYPIRKGYYERITFNDGAMIGVMRLLRDVAEGKSPYAFVDETHREKAERALDKGVEAILKTQIKVDGKLTAWCGQHDERDLTPAGARSYEKPSISGSESVGIVRFLMEIENPSPEVIRAVQSAVEWFDEVQIANTRMVRVEIDGQRDRVIEKDPAYGSIWARFYDIDTNRPIFSGRDGEIKYAMAEIERERRVGYAWYGRWPDALLKKEYPAWRKKWIAE